MPLEYTMRQTLDFIRKTLQETYPQGEIESFIRIIFEHLCGYTTTQLILCRDKILAPEVTLRIHNIVERLLRKEPIQYILGSTYFGEIKLEVGTGVLIPRPETAELVQIIIKNHPLIEGDVADICTGSGCIAIALAQAWKNAHIEGWDISSKALKYAQQNSRNNNTNIHWIQRDVLTYNPICTPHYSIIVSNPPYVLDSERQNIDDNVLLYEPHEALFVPDNEALLFYNAIALIAQHELLPSGTLYFEINTRMGEACRRMLTEKHFTHIEVIQDFTGRDRFIKASKQS